MHSICGYCGKHFNKLVNSPYCNDCRQLCNRCFKEKRYKKEKQCQKCYLEKEKLRYAKQYIVDTVKVCTSCQSSFLTRKVEKTRCDECKKKAARELWAKVGEKYKIRNEETRRQQKVYHDKKRKINERLLQEHYGTGEMFKCEKCGFASKHKVQFSLHHTTNEKSIIPTHVLRRGSFNIDLLKQESLKLICEDCHRTEHSRNEPPYFKELFQIIEKKCQLCGDEPKIGCVNFHHVHPSEKSYNVSKRNSCSKLASAFDEIKKCAILCCKCHNLFHQLLREGQPTKKLKTIGETISFLSPELLVLLDGLRA